jgi:hypothetical protein
LPLTVTYVAAGAGGSALLGGTGNWRHDVLWPTLVSLVALAFSLAIPAWARGRFRHAERTS